MQDARVGGTYPLGPLELAAILEEVRRAVLAVDSDTAEHRPLRAISLTPAEGGDTVAEGDPRSIAMEPLGRPEPQARDPGRSIARRSGSLP